MQPLLNQPARLYATAKTHKFEKLDELLLTKQVPTYDAAKVIGEYIKPLAKFKYRVNDCQEFSDML